MSPGGGCLGGNEDESKAVAPRLGVAENRLGA